MEMTFFNLLAPITYWLLIAMWSFILYFYLKRLRSDWHRGSLMLLLFIILSIDAFRTLFESFYFGAWYTARVGLLPMSIHDFLVQPQMVIFPKLLNVFAAGLIITILFRYWLPREGEEIKHLETTVDLRTRKLSETVEKLEAEILRRAHTEKALKESEAKYMDLYENAPDMYASVNAKTTLIEECNITLANTLGYSKEEIIGHPVFEIYHSDCLEEVKNAFKLFVEIGEIHDKELQLRRKDGSKIEVSLNVSCVRSQDGHILYSRSTLRDITERKRNNAINAARLHLLQFAAKHSLNDLLEETLNAAEKVTDSLIGFYHFVEEDQKSLTLQNWSTRTKAEFCKAEGKGLHYPIAEAGVWVDCVYQGRPVIHNNYASLSHRKGMPQGHAQVLRELVVPVLRGNKIKAILGVGNKPIDYTEKDVEAVSLLADLAWEIAERKQAEEAYRISVGRFEELFDKAAIPLCFVNKVGSMLNINTRFEKIFGYSQEEIPTLNEWWQLAYPDPIYRKWVIDTCNAALQHALKANTDIEPIEYHVTCKKGDVRTMVVFGSFIGNDLLLTFFDISERKEAEAELIKYREHLEELVRERTAELEIAKNKAQQYLDIAGVILVAIDENQRVTLINQKGCEVLGGTAGEIVGKDWFETFVPANIRRDVIKAFNRLMAGEIEPDEYFENPVLTQDGQERLIAWHNALLRDDGGNIIGTLSSGDDITEKKRIEAQISKLNQDLLNRTAALESANKDLEAFAYSVSHDLRAPLRHINGFMELLQKRTARVLDEQSRHYMDTISDSAKRMGTLIDDLLSFSRMGRKQMSCQNVDLGGLTQEIIREFEIATKSRSIHWHCCDLPVVTGDRSMLRIVLVNLISNALKFTQQCQQAEVEIGWLPNQETETVIFVRDNGVGFDMNYADKLFNVFQRLHRVDEFEGTGIGLANVRRIIARHGGRTWAKGKINQGATFYFSLPET